MSTKIKLVKWLLELPGHGVTLHFLLLLLVPRHGRPPLAGRGLLQVLQRFCIPPPQVLLQSSHTPQQLHLP